MESKENKSKDYTLLKGFITNAVAVLVNSVTKTPIDRVRLILQNQDASIQITKDQKYKGITDVVKRVYKEQGLLSFYRGNVPFIIQKIIPTKALFLPLTNYIKGGFNAYNNNQLSFFAGNFLIGGLVGGLGLSLTYPLHYLKVRLAMDLGRTAEERQFKNMRDCIAKTYQSDQILGLYRGYLASILGVGLYRG